MTGRRAPHLQRRNGLYHLRVRVPDTVRPRLGRSEVRRSLGTPSYSEARSIAAQLAAKVMEAFDVILKNQLSLDLSQAIVRACFADLIAETEAVGGFVSNTSEPDIERAEQHHMSGQRVMDLKGQLEACSFDRSVSLRATAVAKSHGVALADQPLPARLDVLSGVARALIEEQRLFQLRIEDRLAPFKVQDELFSPDIAMPPPATNMPVVTRGISVADGVDRYIAQGAWVKKTRLARVWQLRFFVEHVGPGRSMADISVEDVRTFRDAVRRLHRSHGKLRSRPFSERQTDNVAHRISDKTAIVIFEPIKAFLRWSTSAEGLISTNPAENIRMIIGKKPKGEKSRRPFTADELRVIFSAPIYTGCHSLNRRYRPGKRIIRDAKFWVPILAHYTGARLGELIQLHVGDVHIGEPVPFLSINEMNEEGGAEGDRKHVKSEAGIRTVPLHPDLLSLGFGEFVKARQIKGRRGGSRLFSEFHYGSDGQASTVFSKYFARFMDSVGLTDPKIVFHSFRHCVEDAFRDALQPQYLIDRIVGHSDGATSTGYGEGNSLEVKYDSVKAMKLKVRLPELWGCTGEGQ